MKKTWLITGASRGIGLEIVKEALKQGDNVIATAREVTKLSEQFKAHPKQVQCIQLDVQNRAEAQSVAAKCVEKFGGIDILVNNAGFGQLGYFETIEPDAIDQQFSTNVFGMMHVTRAVLPHMRRQRGGYIVNLSSIGGAIGFDGASIYCAAKFAVEGFSESLSIEVARFGINVTIVEPGFFRTDFLDASSVRYGKIDVEDYTAATNSQKSQYDSYSHMQPGDPKKLAQLIVNTAGSRRRPARVIAGSDALSMSRNALNNRLKELEQWATTSASTDYHES